MNHTYIAIVHDDNDEMPCKPLLIARTTIDGIKAECREHIADMLKGYDEMRDQEAALITWHDVSSERGHIASGECREFDMTFTIYQIELGD